MATGDGFMWPRQRMIIPADLDSGIGVGVGSKMNNSVVIAVKS
jgi:hypothetical protein